MVTVRARATAGATTRETARATAEIITTITIATNQDDGNGGHYYECGPGGERRD